MDRANSTTPTITRMDGVDMLDLAHGGTLSLVEVDPGEYRLFADVHGVSVSVPLTRIDVLGLRAITGDAVLRAAGRP